jgi:saccharopine dehydrogenase (NAD+, L-lysine-forming)
MIMIYGANGYSGQLIAEEALRRGLRPILAGRGEGVAVLAPRLGLPSRRFGLDQPDLAGVTVLVNAAGPFGVTGAALAPAAIAAGAHYLDLAGEYPEHRALEPLASQAKAKGVMLLPGVGFGVVPTDCAAVLAAQGLGQIERLVIAYETRGGASRGTLETVLPDLHRAGIGRRAGGYAPVRGGARSLKLKDGRRAVRVVTNPWRADQVSAVRSVGAADIETYASFPGAARLLMRIGGGPLGGLLRKAALAGAPAGPDAAARAKGGTTTWAQAFGAKGARQVIVRGPDAYDFTARTAVACAVRALAGAPAGLQTPATAFGADLIRAIDGVTIETMTLRSSA